MIKSIVYAVGAFVLATSSSVAVQFDLRDSSIDSLDGSDALSLTSEGITAGLSAFVEGNAGVFNRTASGFGINAFGGGDDTDAIDGDNGAESVSITFDFDVLLTSISTSGYSSTDAGQVSIAGLAPHTISSSGTFFFLTDNVVTVGQSVVLSFLSGNGFSFDSFDVELYESGVVDSDPVQPDPANVPDGGASVFLLLGGVCMVSLIRLQKSSL